MKSNIIRPVLGIILLFIVSGCKSTEVAEAETPEEIFSNSQGQGPALEIEFTRGEAHNHPLMAIWIEDMDNNYVQTLYVAESLGKGIFQHGDATTGKWLPAEIRRPAALPVWSHSRGVKEPDGLFVPIPEHAIPDAYTGATPSRSFLLRTKLDKPGLDRFYLLFEINQTWDWNEYWTNNKYPNDNIYKTSCQPSLVYRAMVDLNDNTRETKLEPIGRGHHSGKDGEIYTDHNETMTTAFNITRSILVKEPE
ncbi:MAG: DUF2271 domain-containing protein [Bacteroidales bacterium]|nr:DUF2271 domain-containing protein [Bacteroidales bacterium]